MAAANMVARFVQGEVKAGDTGSAVSTFEQQVLPAYKKLQGFQGATLLTDAKGKFIAITKWDSAANMTAAEADKNLKAQLTKISAFFTGSPGYETYDVSSDS